MCARANVYSLLKVTRENYRAVSSISLETTALQAALIAHANSGMLVADSALKLLKVTMMKC